MRLRSLAISLLLICPIFVYAANFAYERDIDFKAVRQETPIWIPLDAHALLERIQGYGIFDSHGNSVPMNQINESVNLLRDAVIDEVPAPAATLPMTRIKEMLDGNPETAFQPQTSKEVTFRFHFPIAVAPTNLVFQIASGRVEHIRVRIGKSAASLHDAFVGTPWGTDVVLSGELTNYMEVTLRTEQGVLRIAEAQLLVPSTKLLIRAQPNEHYVLRYGTHDVVKALDHTVFTDIHAEDAHLGPVRLMAGTPDIDHDGISDTLDNCPTISNSAQSDRDGDTIGDACDNAPSVPNTKQNDQDKDGIGDGQDNCPFTENPDQQDNDFNGIGWACDDADGDGVMNSKDNCVGLANADQRDLNHNGVGDLCEDDRDRDGVPAIVDNCKTTTNPDQSDQDRDGIGDLCDDCVLQYDPRQLDRNHDGVGDVCEQAIKKTALPDGDGDGIADEKDNCINVQNVDQSDRDGDGRGDRCDNCTTLQNADQQDSDHNGIGDTCTDSDGDSILDPYDNCIAYANPEQSDKNQNGIGDPCDDDDGDRIENARDNCPFDANQMQKDEDQDGIGNVCDHSDDRWSEQRPWLLYGSMTAIILALSGFGALILKKSSKLQG